MNQNLILYNIFKNVFYNIFVQVEYGLAIFLDAVENKNEESGRKLPVKGEPNSSKELYKDGKLKQRRHYDENGNARVDEDFSDHGTPHLHSNPHYHKWTWKNGKPKRSNPED